MGLTFAEKVKVYNQKRWNRQTGHLIQEANASVARDGLDAEWDSLGLVDIAKERLVRDKRNPISEVAMRLAQVQPESRQHHRRQRSMPIMDPAYGYRAPRAGMIADMIDDPAPTRYGIQKLPEAGNGPRKRVVYVAHVHSTALTPFEQKYF